MKQLFYIFFAMLLFSSCHGDPPIVNQPSVSDNGIKEHMINANKTIAQSEETTIDEYIARHRWTMEKLLDGVRIWVYEEGNGNKVKYEDSVYVRYNIEAINGKTFYSDITEGFVAGRRHIMIGLDQAVLQMNYGSRAKIILPSAMAYGIAGDNDRIPKSAILVIDLQISEKNNLNKHSK